MIVLNSIFPGLIDFSGDGLPIWPEESKPWSILMKGDLGLQSQILSILGSDEESYIHPTAQICESAIIESPSYVGPNTIIRHGAYLRGGSWICEGALVGNSSEIKNSILLPYSKAPHFNYVGDSIVGFGANLGAGVKLSNVRIDRKGVAITLEDGTKVDSGLMKMGAIIGDGSQLGCNVVTNPGVIIPPNSMIKPNETITGWFLA